MSTTARSVFAHAGVLACLLAHALPATAQEAAPPRARLHGLVLDRGSGRPVEGVLLGIKGTPLRAETNRQGYFMFAAIPAGTVEVVAERLGIVTETRSFTLEPDRAYDVELRLSAEAVALEPITVTVQARSPWLELQGFYERKYSGGISGHFLTRADIEKRNPHELTDIYDDIPGVRTFMVDPGRRTVRFRRATQVSLSGRDDPGYGCEPAYFIDGARYLDPLKSARVNAEVVNFNALPAAEVEAIETYVGAAVPIQFQGYGSCGVILVWTRHGDRGSR